MVFAIVSCEYSTPDTPVDDGAERFVIATGAEPESLDPSQIQGSHSTPARFRVFLSTGSMRPSSKDSSQSIPRQPTESPASPRAGMSLRTA